VTITTGIRWNADRHEENLRMMVIPAVCRNLCWRRTYSFTLNAGNTRQPYIICMSTVHSRSQSVYISENDGVMNVNVDMQE
jgi:hypothetical protein